MPSAACYRPSEDGRNHVYVSCSNWEACGSADSRVLYPLETLQTVNAAGEPVSGEELADEAFGFSIAAETSISN
jgi:hypothetical protein